MCPTPCRTCIKYVKGIVFISHTTTLKLRKTRNTSKILYPRIQFSLMTFFFRCWWFYFCLLDHLEWKTLSALDMSNLRFAKAWHPQKITSDQKIVTHHNYCYPYKINIRHDLIFNTRARVSGGKTLMKNFRKKSFESKSHICAWTSIVNIYVIWRGIPAHLMGFCFRITTCVR